MRKWSSIPSMNASVNVALNPKVAAPSVPDEMPPALRADFAKQYRELQARVDESNENLATARRQIISYLSQFDNDDLAELVNACDMAPEMRQKISMLPREAFQSSVVSDTGELKVHNASLWKTAIDVLDGILQKNPAILVGAIERLREKQKSRFKAEELDAISMIAESLEGSIATNENYEDRIKPLMEKASGRKEATNDARRAALESVGKTYEGFKEKMISALEPLMPEDRKSIVESLLSVPNSTLLDPARRVLLEWGTYFMRTVNEFGEVNHMTEEMTHALHQQTLQMRANDLVLRPSIVALLQGAALMAIMTSASWARAGFPLVQPTHTLAASLMATYMPRDLVPEIELPWKSFAVLVPNGLLPEVGGRKPATMVAISSYDVEDSGPTGSRERRVVWIARGDALLEGTPFEKLEELVIEENDDPITREHALLLRLLLGSVVELDQPRHREVVRRGPPAPKAPGKKRHAGPPSCWAFDLRRDTRVDLRPWVKNYLDGGTGSSPGVQILVRGHHKRQRCGKGGLERRWIHIEPYWRGPEDAPVAVRALRLEKKS